MCFNGMMDPPSGTVGFRGFSGASLSLNSDFLFSSNQDSSVYPPKGDYDVCFRVATVPGPSSLIAVAIGVTRLVEVASRRRQRTAIG
jgi:hypothetical protein